MARVAYVQLDEEYGSMVKPISKWGLLKEYAICVKSSVASVLEVSKFRAERVDGTSKLRPSASTISYQTSGLQQPTAIQIIQSYTCWATLVLLFYLAHAS